MAKQDITIYYTSDLHGHFYPTTYGDKTQRALGLFRCAPGFVKTPNTLVIDGGDTLQGSPFTAYCVKELRSARPVAEIMNRCGYDVVTLGNHDFNYGADYLREYLTQGNFACVCENLKDETGKSIFPRLVKVMENGLRVGIVGIVTDHVNIWEKPENLAGVQVTSPLEAAREALAALRQEADLTICIYHGGFERDLRTGRLLSSSGENIAYQLCQELDFDILLTGHQHLSLPGRLLHGTFALQCADNGREYHRLEVSVQDGKPVIRSQAVAAQAPPDPELMQAFSGLEAQVQHWLDQSVGSLPYPPAYRLPFADGSLRQRHRQAVFRRAAAGLRRPALRGKPGQRGDGLWGIRDPAQHPGQLSLLQYPDGAGDHRGHPAGGHGALRSLFRPG